MKTNNTEVEEACASVANALVGLVTAICSRTVAEQYTLCLSTPLELSPSVEPRADPPVCKPGDRRIYVYCAGSQGAATLAREHGPKIMSALGSTTPYITKCGTTSLPLPTRLRQIGQDQYGAAVQTKNGIELQAGFSSWVAHAIATSRQSRDPAVHVLPRAIAVDRPSGLSSRAFDAELHRELKNRALDALPAKIWPRRLCAYDLGETRYSSAREFYALCPYDVTDGDRLLAAVENIVKRFRDLSAGTA